MPRALKEVIRCPKCGGAEVIYSCEPKCCFNHVCADCRSTFEINTEKTSEVAQPLASVTDPESSDPTTACAFCNSLRLHVQISDPEILVACGDCGAFSRVVIENFVAGDF